MAVVSKDVLNPWALLDCGADGLFDEVSVNVGGVGWLGSPVLRIIRSAVSTAVDGDAVIASSSGALSAKLVSWAFITIRCIF